MNLRSFVRPCGIVLAWLLLCRPAPGQVVDKEFLQSLPAEEQAMQDTVDHWGLPFSDQLRRFVAARAEFRRALGDAAPGDFFVGIEHGLEKVPRNKYWFKGRYGTSIALEAARNESESFQVAVIPDVGKALADVVLEPRDLRHAGGRGTIPAAMIRVYRVGYVDTVPARYPSLYTGAWPDALLPNAPIAIGGTDLGLFWVDVKVPVDARPGDYSGRIELRVDGRSVPVEIALHVHGFALPDRVPFPIAVWTSPTWPSGEKMTPAEYRDLAAEFLAHGVDPVSIGTAFVSLDKPDFDLLDENLAFCFERGLQLFEVPSPRGDVEKLGPLVEHLREKGWLDRAIVYSNQDEPDAAQFAERNVPFCREIRSRYPGLRVYLASEHHAGIDEGCDVWMTDLSSGRGIDFARNNRGRAELWVYYCHLPIRIDFVRPLVHAPNMQIDNEAIEHRLALWLAWKYQTPGMFIWAGNRQWASREIDRSDWEQTGWKLGDKPSGFPYGGIHNGNGYLMYPGPYPTLRLKVLRDGLDDYGYLAELARRAKATSDPELRRRAEALLAIAPSVLIDSHYFNRDPAGLLENRKEIARTIDILAAGVR